MDIVTTSDADPKRFLDRHRVAAARRREGDALPRVGPAPGAGAGP